MGDDAGVLGSGGSMEQLASTTTGSGALVALVHGGMNTGALAWFAQAELCDRYRVRVYDRAGYGASSSLAPGEDINLDARLIAADLGEPAHLVGHSSGAIVAMCVAALAPTMVQSLTVIEPPAYGHVDDPRLHEIAAATDALMGEREASDREWLKRFVALLGGDPQADAVLDILEPHIATLRQSVTRAADVVLPIDAIRAAAIPVLVVSGGSHEAFEIVSNQIADELGAERAVIPGAGHAVQMTGRPFNETLERFLAGATTS
jgi:pimeloyl-ACP methyl ester carboxylesterase